MTDTNSQATPNSTHPEHSEWLRLRSELAKKGIRLPQYLSEAEGLRPLLDTLY